MEKKKLTKLSLKKETISRLTEKQQAELQGGGFTTWGNCKSKFTCCETNNSLPKSCVPNNCEGDYTHTINC